jgi:uncharacterized glyoxalase superfamily protein PhnB
MSETTPATEKDRSVASSVEVVVGPAAAFAAFTDELDQWWVRGPINHHAAGRVVAMRCEPGVGGRLLEVYDDESGDALELGRITAWEPGVRLAWQSSLDDVETEVRFEPSGTGTLVRVTARIPGGGDDRGGTSWVRVVPRWFGTWCARRDHAPREVQDLARLALGVYYARPAAQARWLARAFGFASPDPLPDGEDPLPEGEHGHPWIEFRLGNSSLMVFKRTVDGPAAPAAHVPWVYVDDIEDHFRRSCDAGATVVEPLSSPWGLPLYVAADPEGNHWTFAQARPTMR